MSESPQIAVTVSGGTPTAQFTRSINGLTVTFTNTSINATSYSWNFGDPASGSNNTSTLANPTHIYTAAGTYTVTLTAYNNCATPALQHTTTQTIVLEVINFCNGNTTFTTCSGSFSDGSGSQNYNNNQSCSWLITPSGAATITLTLTNLQTEQNFDFVRVYNGSTTAAPLLGTYSGTLSTVTVNTTGPAMLVTFTTDGSVTAQGFNASYTCTTTPTCTGTTVLNTCSGTITDGSGANNYTNNLNCAWLISPTNATSVTLNFTAFTTESGFDFVYVYNGTGATAPLIGSYSGSTIPASVTANSGSMYVRFVTDASVTAAGWIANYSCTVPVTCSGTTNLTSCTGSFTDGSGSQNYGNNLSCSWLIAPAGAVNITLNFTQFNTESGNDVVRVYNGSNTSAGLLGAFSGSSLPGTLVSTGPTMFVTFTTNSSVAAAGFTANYSCNLVNPCSGVSATAQPTHTTCGLNNGSIFVSTVGFTNPVFTWSPATVGNLQNPANLAPGTYTVSVSGGGCTATASATINSSAPLSVSAGANSPVCAGDAISLNSNGGASYAWSGPNGFTSTQQNPVIPAATMAMGGIYVVTVTGNNGCTRTASASVSVQSLPVATASANNPCAGNVFTLSAGSGVGFTYLWSGPNGFTTTQQNPTVSTNASSALNGVYTVIVTNAGGCSAVASVVVNVADNIEPIISGVPNLCAGTNTPLSVVGSYASYLWSTGATSPAITITNGGIYAVTVSNATGCTGSSVIEITTSPLPVVQVGSNSPVCTGNVLNLSCSGGSTYQWSGPNGFSANIPNPVLSFATTAMGGTYSVTVTNIDGCSATASVAVVVQQPPVVTASSNNPCTGGLLTLSASSGGLSYSWLGPNGFTSNQQNPMVTNSAAAIHSGIYTLTVFGPGGCNASQSVSVTVSNALNPIISGNTTPCQGTTSLLSVGAGYSSYTWNTGANTPDITISVGGNYTVTVTNAAGCLGVVSKSVTFLPAPMAFVSTNSPVCENYAINLSSSGGTVYQWSGPNGYISSVQNPVIGNSNLNMAGLYSVVVSNASGCTGSAVATVVIVPQSNAGTDNSASVCNDASEGVTTVDVNTLINGMPGGIFYPLNGAPVLAGGSLFNGVNLNPGAVYQYQYTVSGTTPCPPDEAVITLAVSDCAICTNPPVAEFSYTNTNYCVNGGTILPVLATGASTGVWSVFPSGLSLNPNNGAIDLANSLPGAYVVTNFIAASGACPAASADRYIVVNATPTASVLAQPSTICSGQTAQLTGSAGFNYQWSTGQSGQPITVAPTNSANYHVTVTNTAGCSSTSMLGVTVQQPPSVVVGSNNPCAGGIFVLNATGGVNYLWSGPNGFIASLQNPTVSGSATSALNGLYTVTVTAANGCTGSGSVTVNVTNILSPEIWGETTICQGNFTTLDAGAGYMQYAWNNGLNTASLTTSTPGNYAVTVTNADGCTGSAAKAVVVNPKPDVQVSSNSPVCIGNDIQFQATGGSTYLWSGPNNFNSVLPAPSIVNVTNAATGIYTVTATNSFGCSENTAVNVAVHYPPNAGLNNSAAVCNNAEEGITLVNLNALVTGISGGTFSPMGDAPPLTSGSIFNGNGLNPNVTHQYLYTVSGSASCPNSTAVLSITVNDCVVCVTEPIATFGYNSSAYCAYSGITAVPVLVAGATSGIWTANPAGLSINPVNGIVTPNASLPGTYTVTNFIAASGACPQAVAGATITIYALPTANAGTDQSICDGQNATLTASGGLSYQWGNGMQGQSITVSPNQNTGYAVTVTDANSCTAADVVWVNISAPPVADAGLNQSICPGQTTILTASGGVDYIWSTGQTGATVSVLPLSAGFYTVTVTGANTCTATDSVWVALYSLSIANAGEDQTICTGSSALLNATGGIQYVWDTGQTGAAIAVNPTTNTNYTVTVTDTNGCTAADMVWVYVNAPQIANAGPDQTICNGQSATLTASGGLSYQWSNNLGNNATITLTPDITGTYTVTVTDANGCTDDDSVTITVNQTIFGISSPNVGINGPLFICLSNGGYTMSFSISGGVPPYMVNGNMLSGNNYTSGELYSAAWSYQIADSENCTYQFSGAAPACSPLPACMVSAIITPVYDAGGCLDGFTATAMGGLPTGSVLFSTDGLNFQTSGSFVNLNAGVYPVYAYRNGCGAWQVGSFTMPANTLQVYAYATQQPNGSYNGIAVVSGGTPLYTYLWSNGATGSATNLGAFTQPYTVSVTDKDGCTQWFVLNPSVITGLPDNVLTEAAVNIYPNPNYDGLLYLVLPDHLPQQLIQITVFDIMGRQLPTHIEMPSPDKPIYSIKLTTYSPGVYFVQIQLNVEKLVKKIQLFK
ncbi:MAG TPA: PKD domain-containing protein [Chitinophagales bacterium]|nr:PKD domain-containing protein [Chitinophagales bacterium]HRK28841.1 PKD domain-containing protein [Chitinophagales bacterium]